MSETQDPDHDVRLEDSADGPVLVVGDTRVLLRTHLYLANEGYDETLQMESEIETDEVSWWNLSRPDGEEYPWAAIQPEVLDE